QEQSGPSQQDQRQRYFHNDENAARSPPLPAADRSAPFVLQTVLLSQPHGLQSGQDAKNQPRQNGDRTHEEQGVGVDGNFGRARKTLAQKDNIVGEQELDSLNPQAGEPPAKYPADSGQHRAFGQKHSRHAG